jgi:purine-nucleoside phosphorylase
MRIGTCGSIQENVVLGDLILAMTASTDSNFNRRALNGLDFAPAADFELLRTASDLIGQRHHHVGGVASMDMFYDSTDSLAKLQEYGVLALEMETSALYSLAAKYRRRAMSLLTVSDEMLTHKAMPAIEREQSLRFMVETALASIISA